MKSNRRIIDTHTVGQGGIIFSFVNTIIMLFVIAVTLYPFIYVFLASVSDPNQIRASSGLLLWPKGFNVDGYSVVMQDSAIKTGYLNTLFYVSVGTFLNVAATGMLAFVLAQKNHMLRTPLSWMIILPMFLNGGLIPTFLVVRSLGLYNSVWAVILTSLISTWNLIIMRTNFQQIPDSLLESARIDGANDIIILFKIVIPVSKAIIAVIALYYAVGHWNSWFSAMIYLRNPKLKPLQLVMREILILSTTDSLSKANTSMSTHMRITENVKYASIIVSTLPILVVYPFVQKYFVKGVMIGSMKG